MNGRKGPKIALIALLSSLILSLVVTAIDDHFPFIANGAKGLRINDIPIIPAVRIGVDVFADQFADSLRRVDAIVSSTDGPEDQAKATARVETLDLPRACTVLSQYESEQLEAGFALMRKSVDGDMLFNLLIEYDVCIDVEAMSYNSGYLAPDGSEWNQWRDTELTVDDELLSRSYLPILAMTLVHEAAHFESLQSGKSCQIPGNCTVLSNRVIVEEEMYATATEAQWVIDVYGRDGARTKFADWPGVLETLEAFEGGNAALRAYIIETRSDSREGEGIGSVAVRVAA